MEFDMRAFFILVVANLFGTAYADTVQLTGTPVQQIQQLNTQIQNQIKQNHTLEQQQIEKLNSQIQAQIRQMQSQLQQQIQKLSTQTQAQIAQVQTTLQQQIKLVHEEVMQNKG
jgi:ElaB/YqjD/DUF883 family membrane-anchored ribosome-binding protein